MAERRQERRERLRAALSAGMEGQFQIDDEELLERIDEAIRAECGTEYLPLGQRVRLRRELYDSFRRLDILQELVDDPEVTEIMVNGTDRIFVEKQGKLIRWDRSFSSTEQLEDLIQQVVSRVNRTVNFAQPIADARLEDGSRVHVVLPPAALDGPTLTIRKFPEAFDMERLIFGGSITEEAADFLEKLVKAGYNIFVSGGTGSGKTTFLNALSGFIPAGERIITIEDSAELQIRHIPNLVRLETRAGSNEGVSPVTMTDLIRASLRMRPTRIIVGEVRGGEALDMLQAMNTGHDGSMSTGHANSAPDMLSRLETMILMGMDLPLPAIRGQLASGIDIIVHLGRLRDKTRKLLEICEVDKTPDERGNIVLHTLFRFEETSEEDGRIMGEWRRINALSDQTKLRTHGLTLPAV